MNNQPTKEEINKKLAEFMGNKIAIPSNLHELSERQLTIYLPFSHSLDALIPVWKKLGVTKVMNINLCMGGDWNSCQVLRFKEAVAGNKCEDEPIPTIQEAAALATYYAVMENEKNG